VNPLAGLHPTHSDLPILATLAGIPYQQLIGEILQAAKLRTGLVQPRRRRRLSA
jgi:D-alanine-D-alanine ligase